MKYIASIAVLFSILTIQFVPSNVCKTKDPKGAQIIQKGEKREIKYTNISVYCQGYLRKGISVNA